MNSNEVVLFGVVVFTGLFLRDVIQRMDKLEAESHSMHCQNNMRKVVKEVVEEVNEGVKLRETIKASNTVGVPRAGHAVNQQGHNIP